MDTKSKKDDIKVVGMTGSEVNHMYSKYLVKVHILLYLQF